MLVLKKDNFKLSDLDPEIVSYVLKPTKEQVILVRSILMLSYY